MSHRVHAVLGIAVEFFGFLAGVLLAARFLGNPVGVVAWIPWFLALVVAALVPRALYRRLVPARCPSCRRVASTLRGTHPWRYECRACGHVHETTLSDGGGPSLHGEAVEEEAPSEERAEIERPREA